MTSITVVLLLVSLFAVATTTFVYAEAPSRPPIFGKLEGYRLNIATGNVLRPGGPDNYFYSKRAR